MNLFHEWPLVLFTLTVQLAVGLHLALLTARSLPRGGRPAGSPEPESEGPSGDEAPSLQDGGLMAAAMAISLLHLGAPLSAVHTLSNLGGSWLSREILALLVFLGLWGLPFWFGRRPGTSPWMARALAWAAALVGIVLIWVMARIYMIPARPLWDHWLTAAGFLLTTLLLGAVAGAASMERPSVSRVGNPAAPSLTGPALMAVGAAASLAQVAATLAHPVTGEVINSPGGTFLAGLRLLLLLGGAVLLTIPLARSSFQGVQPLRTGLEEGIAVQFEATVAFQGPWATAALFVLGTSEVLGRALFYAVGTVNPF